MSESRFFKQPIVVPAPMPPANEGARRAAVDRAREGWIKKLIDVSRRNNLLYYRDLQTGTLDLTNAEPKAFAALLAGDSVGLTRLLVRADELRAPARLRAIQQRALLNLEEKGIETLFLALGMATWTPIDEGRPAAAAVLLLPVGIETRGRDRRDVLLRRTGDAQVNLVLLHVLETGFGCVIAPEEFLDGITSETEPFDPQMFYKRMATAAGDVPGFAVTPRAVLSNFSFQKMAMVKDLRERVVELAMHDVVAAVAGDAGARHQLRARRVSVDPTTLDRALPDQEFLILDADSSQQRVVAGVLSGQDAVIQGPPGTGKSQTIANMIAVLAAQGKRVLFVAEKRAALEVVLHRLDIAGLGHLALDLHGADISRREVMRQFGLSLGLVRDAPPVDAADVHSRFAERRARLNDHVWRLHTPRKPSGMSFYELQGRLLQLPAAPRASTRWRGEVLQPLDSPTAAAVRDLLIEAGGFGGLFLRDDPSPWSGALLSSGGDVQRAVDMVARLLYERWPTLQSSMAEVLAVTGLREPETLDDTADMLDLLEGIVTTRTMYGDGLFAQDLPALLSTFEPASRGWLAAAWAFCTNGGYRAARTMLREMRREPAPDAQIYTELLSAVEQSKRWNQRSAAQAQPPVTPELEVARNHLTAFSTDLHALVELLGQPSLAQRSFADLVQLLEALSQDTATPFRVPRLLEIERRIDELHASAIVEELRRTKPQPEYWPLVFEHAWLASCLDAARAEEPTLAGFYGRTHDGFVAEFRELDRRRLSLAAARVRRAQAERAIGMMNSYPEQTTLVRREAEKKSRHLPLRRLLAEAPEVLTALRPCWMASPLSVSQLLDASQRYFDVVIFDEASQVPPEDAIAALLRGSQVVVAGDKHQLPPTAFFATGEAEDEEVDLADATEGFESVLDVMSACFDPWALEWHYRSRDEALIAFANQHIYDNRLITFPSAGGPPAVSHELVKHSGHNGWEQDSVAGEVRRVVELVLDHARTRPHETLGVITMGIRHAQQIEAALEDVLRGLPQFDAFFDQQREERFFVKNLERVQGDERDAIILSIGYGKDSSGRLPYRFGPLLMQGGERRLNVAITRARQRMTLVSSFDHLDMDPNRSRARGVDLLRQYLHYTSTASTRVGGGNRGDGELDLFHANVLSHLASHGLSAVPRYGASRYRVDFAILHPTQPERFVMALETDGASYGMIPTARDRDRLRQQQLESLGWHYHRLWAIDWFVRRDEEIRRILDLFSTGIASDSQFQPALEPIVPATGVTVRLEQPHAAAPTRGPRPNVGNWSSITDYTEEELITLVRWIRSDGKLRTDDEIAEEMVQELGFRRRGPRIMAAIRNAIVRAR